MSEKKHLRLWLGWWDENRPGNHRHMALDGQCYVTEAEDREDPGTVWPYLPELQGMPLDQLLALMIGSAHLSTYDLVKQEVSATHALLRFEKRNTRRRVLSVRQFELYLEDAV